MNAGAECGTLETGKLTNIVIVAGKPNQKYPRYQKYRERYIREGTILDRNKLKLDPAADTGYQPIGGMASPGSE